MAAEKDKQINEGFDGEVDDEVTDDDLDPDADAVDEDDDADIGADLDDDFDADEDEDAAAIDKVVELTNKEQSARALEIRRALEERMERRRMQDDLDYLDFDSDD